MRRLLSLASFAWICYAVSSIAQAQPAATPACADLHLVPAARECREVATVPVGQLGVVVAAVKKGDDEFAAKDLEDTLKSLGVQAVSSRGARIDLVRADAPAIRTFLKNHDLTFTPAMHDEGYVLALMGENSLAVIAETAEGIFYGAQTVKQLIRGSGTDCVLLAPTIRDWPAMAHRGLSDDWSRGPLPSMEFLKREIRTLAAYKYNIFSPYFEHTFAYASAPVAAFPGGAMTPDEARELVDYAAKYHITVIPEQEAFGHLHHVLKFEQYSPLGETPHGSVLAPGDAGSLPLIASWFGELAKVFPGPYTHIGADETFELGLGRTRDEVKQQGLGKVYLDFLSRIHQTLEPNHKRLLFWGDIAENQPELVGTLPKDMIAVPWHYDAKPDFTKAIEPFIRAGLETWVAPGVSNWSRLYPDNNVALDNIRAFVRDGQKLGATGMLNTVWNDDGEGVFDENWFGVLFGAAAAWQPGEASEQEFTASFGQAFHRDATGKISEAQRAMMAAHAVLKKVGLEDAQDSYFWVDPFSAKGREIGAKLLPVAGELRLDAERALTVLAQARKAATLDNQEALDAMELGARRIDFVGLKFQFAADCGSFYAQAQTIAGDKSREDEVANLLYTIGSNNGRMQDIRDGYALLGQLFEKAWLRDNRPYWLANNTAHFAAATQLWINRGEQWDSVIDGWDTTHTLPPASEVGVPAAK